MISLQCSKKPGCISGNPEREVCTLILQCSVGACGLYTLKTKFNSVQFNYICTAPFIIVSQALNRHQLGATNCNCGGREEEEKSTSAAGRGVNRIDLRTPERLPIGQKELRE